MPYPVPRSHWVNNVVSLSRVGNTGNAPPPPPYPPPSCGQQWNHYRFRTLPAWLNLGMTSFWGQFLCGKCPKPGKTQLSPPHGVTDHWSSFCSVFSVDYGTKYNPAYRAYRWWTLFKMYAVEGSLSHFVFYIYIKMNNNMDGYLQSRYAYRAVYV